MKPLGWVGIKLILSVELVFAGSNGPSTTHVEQVSAEIRGHQYTAQITQVQMPTQDSKTIVVKNVSVVSPTSRPAMATSVAIEKPTRLNGTLFTASVHEPLAAIDRDQALSAAANQVDWVRRQAPPEIASSVESSPAYSSVAGHFVIQMGYSPYSEESRRQIDMIVQKSISNSDQVFAGILQQEQARNQEAANFAGAIQKGQNLTLQLRQGAEKSTFRFTNSMSDFSAAMDGLQNRAAQNIVTQIQQSDPVLQNILSDNETGASKDIRRASSDVSPLNPHAGANFARYGDRFQSSGLLRAGLFNRAAGFPTTPAGHRLMESANLLSDAVLQNSSLAGQTSSRQLVGAGYLYLNAAMQAQDAGRTDAAARWTAEGRRIARALRGEALPDDLEEALVAPASAIEFHEKAVRETMGLQGEGRTLLTQAFNAVNPTTSEGQAAAVLGRALLQNPHGLSDAELRNLSNNLLDLALGMVPVVSSIKSLIYIAAGKNLITGERLTALDYTLCVVDILSLGVGGTTVAGKIVHFLPEMGPAFKGSSVLLGKALADGGEYVKNFGKFVGGAVQGLREVEAIVPGYALKNFATNPGAVLALGHNISQYGGAELAKDLLTYSAKNSLSVVETAHISEFAGGLTKFIPAEAFEKYVSQAEKLSSATGGRFYVASAAEYEAAAKGLKDDAALGNWLSLKKGDESAGLIRVDIEFDLKMNPRLPAGTESGVNEYFRLGGKTAGGARELVVDPILMSNVKVVGKVIF